MCYGAPKPTRHNSWACALQPGSCKSVLREEKPPQWEAPCHNPRKACAATKTQHSRKQRNTIIHIHINERAISEKAKLFLASDFSGFLWPWLEKQAARKGIISKDKYMLNVSLSSDQENGRVSWHVHLKWISKFWLPWPRTLQGTLQGTFALHAVRRPALEGTKGLDSGNNSSSSPAHPFLALQPWANDLSLLSCASL